ncbi:MAG TPA: DUF1659 domain-containing protein [Longimicrobiales bacterium]
MRTVMRFDLRLLAIVGVVATLTACEQERFVGPDRSLDGDSDDFLLDLKDAGGFPGGESTITSFELVADVEGNPDAFQRAGKDGYYNSANSRYEVHAGTRIAGQDPRLPALAPLPDPSAVSTAFARIMGPEYWGANMWDLYMRWTGLEPGAVYTFALERLATRVNGLVDHLEMILYGEVTEPDELVPLGGTAGGYPANDYAWTDNAGCQAEPIPDPLPNPWYLGAFAADGSGVGTADYCMGTPWAWYQNQSGPPVPDSSIVVPNVLGTGPVPAYQYNYVVVYQGEPPDLGPPVLRIQLGVDLDLAGNPLPNAFAPFPLFEDRIDLIDVPGVEARVSALEFTTTSLAPLAGTEYSLWLFDSRTGNLAAATADYTRILRVQTGVDDEGNPIYEDDPQPTVRTATFNAGAADERHHFVLNSETLDGVATGDYTHVLIALGTSEPTGAVPLWVPYLDDGGTADPADDALVQGPVGFGTLDLAAPRNPRLFQATGGAKGSFWADRLGIAFQNLRRPPVGYYYALWLVAEDGTALELGPLTTPPPDLASLRDADVDDSFDVVTAGEILEAGFYIDAADVGQPWTAFQSLRVTLQPKVGAQGIAPHIVLSGPLPEALFR